VVLVFWVHPIAWHADGLVVRVRRHDRPALPWSLRGRSGGGGGSMHGGCRRRLARPARRCRPARLGGLRADAAECGPDPWPMAAAPL